MESARATCAALNECFESVMGNGGAMSAPAADYVMLVPSQAEMGRQLIQVAEGAQQLAKSVLPCEGQKDPSATQKGATVTVLPSYHYGHCCCHDNWFWWWWLSSGRTEVHHHHYDRPFQSSCESGSRKTKKDEDLTRVLVGLAAAVVLGVAAYSLGQDLGMYRDAGVEKSRLAEEEHRILISAAPIDLRYEALEVVHDEEKIVNSVRSSAVTGLALKAALAVSSGVILFGAFGSKDAAMMWKGAGAAAVAASLLTIRWGVQMTDQTLQKQAHRLLDRAVALKDRITSWV